MKTLLLSAALMLFLPACNPPEPVAPAAVGAAPEAAATAGERVADGSPRSIVNWGERTTLAGVPFNVQADGHSGVWFELDRTAPSADVVVSFDGRPLTGVVVSGVIITATIPPEYLAEPGSYPVVVELQPGGTRVEAGNFEVVKP